ncbi:MAG: 2-hydroxy-3-oxopropionate reductase [Gammaproteobacteria bacterium SG8_47]|nr:MAG: 2-hydroxy-3-oxopropionate reductase [Gammaproteobacteria bacterium SG8_47]
MAPREKERIGFIGLGIMGRPMALNLISAGYPLWVYARRRASLAPLLEAGAVACPSPKSLASEVDVVITIVSDTPDVEQVILGPDGVVAGAQPQSLVIDMSTISPVATRRIAAALGEHDIEMLDAPVSGGEQGAIDAALSIMVGGNVHAFERAQAIFATLGKRVVHIGDHGSGQIAKSCNQLVIAQTLTAVGEAFLLAKRNGADPAKVREVLLGGLAASRVLEVHGQRALRGDFHPGFKASLHSKDLRIVLESASASGLALPATALAAQYMSALVAEGHGDLDSAALVSVLEKLSGTVLRDD